MQDFADRMAQRARGKTPSPIRELLKFAGIQDMISLGGGYPNPDTFIFSSVNIGFKGSARTITLEGADLAAASQYGPSRVDARLEPQLLKWHVAKGGPAPEPGGMVVLNGSQEGLFILAYLFLDPGDYVVVDEPTYPGAISAFESFKARFVSVPLDGEGMDTDALARVLDERRRRSEPAPKLLYTVPNGHNPGGVAMSLRRRRHLMEIAREHDLVVIEDDPYQLLNYDVPPPTSLQELDGDGRVIRLDSFSKIFVPGFRVGYATARPDVIRQFELFKQSSNLHTSSFNQRILAAYLETEGPEGLLAHIERNRAFYRRNRDAMVAGAREFLPPEVRFEVPGSGLFVWFQLPERVDALRMHQRSTEKHLVLLVPGNGFSTQGGCRNCMRASFGTVPTDRIREGMRRFGAMLAEELR